jgi:hypothetical protein
MSTDRSILTEVDLVPPERVLDEEFGSMDSLRPETPRLTPEEREVCATLIAEHVAHLEQIPTADLSTAALRRLTLVAIEVSGADPLGGEQLHTLGSEHDPGTELSNPSRGKSVGVEVATIALRRGRPPWH